MCIIFQVNSDTTIGTLVIKSTERRDTGNYTCAPSNLDSASVMLHVLNGKLIRGGKLSYYDYASVSQAQIHISLSLCLWTCEWDCNFLLSPWERNGKLFSPFFYLSYAN
jgi:hypothetical protein